jgi:LAS superfamily LD-carboxypeptidase LdcB
MSVIDIKPLSGKTIKQLTGQSDEHIHWLSDKLGIHHQMRQAWAALCQSAATDGFELVIASGFRDFSRQLMLWNNKYSGVSPVYDLNNNVVALESLSDKQRVNAILLFSALPGASRHHWGSDIDVYAKNLLAPGQTLQLAPWEYQDNGPFAALHLWLKQHSLKFGFYFPYDKYRQGVAHEPWHLSFIPLARQYQQLSSPDIIKASLENSDILGKQIICDNLADIFKQYVTNVNSVMSH